MIPDLRVIVEGLPLPKGSMRAFVRGGKAVLTNNNASLAHWERTIRVAAEDNVRHGKEGHWPAPPEQAVSVFITFYMPHPKAHLRRDGTVRLDPQRYAPTKRPDIDKLGRAVLDALTGVAYLDDSQVVRLVLRKRYAQRWEIGTGPVAVSPSLDVVVRYHWEED